MVINDFLRGKIPWYIPDPSWPERKAKEKDDDEFANTEGRLGEMRLKGGKREEEVETESGDALDMGSSVDGENSTDESQVSDLDNVEDSIQDPRPSKRVRR